MWLQDVLNRIKAHSFFKPETSSATKRLQIFLLGGLFLVALGILYGVMGYILKSPAQQEVQQKDSPPTQIESGYDKTGSEGAWRYTMDESLKGLQTTIRTLQETLEKQNHAKAEEEETRQQELNQRFADLESQIQDRRLPDNALPGEMQGTSEDLVEPTIQKITLNLPGPMVAKTVDTMIPAGAFAQTVLLSGLDASAAMNASSDPRPMLLRIVDYGTLPRKFQSDLKDCHCTASAFGDISSERVYARLEKLSCIEVDTGALIETQVAGYIAGPDGKAGIRGIVASKDGQFLSRSLMGGIFSGLSNVANPQNRRNAANPFVMGGQAAPPIGMAEHFGSGMASGASSALDRLSQYYIDRAEQLQPVIQVAAGQVVDIVFTEGVEIGSQTVKDELQKTRDLNPPQGAHQ